MAKIDGVAELVDRSRGLKKLRCDEFRAVPQADRDHGVAAGQIALARKARRNVEFRIGHVARRTHQRLSRIPTSGHAAAETRVGRFCNTGCVRKQQVAEKVLAVAIEASAALSRISTADRFLFDGRTELGAIRADKAFTVRIEAFLPHHGAREVFELAEPARRDASDGQRVGRAGRLLRDFAASGVGRRH